MVGMRSCLGQAGAAWISFLCEQSKAFCPAQSCPSHKLWVDWLGRSSRNSCGSIALPFRLLSGSSQSVIFWTSGRYLTPLRYRHHYPQVRHRSQFGRHQPCVHLAEFSDAWSIEKRLQRSHTACPQVFAHVGSTQVHCWELAKLWFHLGARLNHPRLLWSQHLEVQGPRK